VHESRQSPVHEGADLVRLRLDIGYDGTNFAGWAMQPGLRSVQHEIEHALGILLRSPNTRVALTVGGRTDAGVHARGQVAHLDVTHAQLARWTGEIEERGALLAVLRARRINGILKRSSPDVVVHAVTEMPQGFNARFSATKRRYEYRVRGVGVRTDPLSRDSTVDVPYALDLEAMQRAAASLVGLRDFTTFCKARAGSTAVRHLLEFEWRRADDGVFVARIVADAFCHSMVRALVGAVVRVGDGRISEPELERLLEARHRSHRFTVMPAHGLSLEEISYPPIDELATQAELTRARRVAIPPIDRDALLDAAAQ
jgi:tRNA pseudouridine38-40 synthase